MSGLQHSAGHRHGHTPRSLIKSSTSWPWSQTLTRHLPASQCFYYWGLCSFFRNVFSADILDCYLFCNLQESSWKIQFLFQLLIRSDTTTSVKLLIYLLNNPTEWWPAYSLELQWGWSSSNRKIRQVSRSRVTTVMTVMIKKWHRTRELNEMKEWALCSKGISFWAGGTVNAIGLV